MVWPLFFNILFRGFRRENCRLSYIGSKGVERVGSRLGIFLFYCPLLPFTVVQVMSGNVIVKNIYEVLNFVFLRYG